MGVGRETGNMAYTALHPGSIFFMGMEDGEGCYATQTKQYLLHCGYVPTE